MNGGGERYLVTGALGCIGAWTVRNLVREGAGVVAFDRAGDPRRLRLIMSDEELARVTFVTGDITDGASIGQAVAENAITNIIHLAALQVPFVRADPPLGALVDVVGTVNVFEVAKRYLDRMAPVVYAGSIGMYEAADAGPAGGVLRVDAPAHPRTHYGVFKLANEGNARVYWLDDRLSTIGIRPMTVYGPGRDQGLTSGPTMAILAAILGRRYRIGFGGRTLLQYAEDVASTMVAASRSGLSGAHVFNLGGSLTSMDELIEAIELEVPSSRGLLDREDIGLPFPEAIASTGLEVLGDVPVTPLGEGIHRTVGIFRDALARGVLDVPTGA